MDRIYYYFKSLFGGELHDFLTGFDCDGNYIASNNQYNTIGLVTIIITLAFVLLYYYVINHPRFNSWWSWCIVLVVCCATNFFYGYDRAYTNFNNGLIPECFMENEDGVQLITESNCWDFGTANLFVSLIAFILLSFILKWWSRNCKHSPFL